MKLRKRDKNRTLPLDSQKRSSGTAWLFAIFCKFPLLLSVNVELALFVSVGLSGAINLLSLLFVWRVVRFAGASYLLRNPTFSNYLFLENSGELSVANYLCFGKHISESYFFVQRKNDKLSFWARPLLHTRRRRPVFQ